MRAAEKNEQPRASYKYSPGLSLNARKVDSSITSSMNKMELILYNSYICVCGVCVYLVYTL